jgi:hypothetical protein
VIPVRVVLGLLVLAAVMLGGCAGWSQTPYNPQQACTGVGGVFTADGRCLAGNM